MDVLVTGGTGFVGREIVRQLRNSGHRVVLMVRHPESPVAREIASQCNVKLRPGSVTDPDAVQKACQGVEAVVHLVGIISEVGGQTFENIHERGTRNMVFGAQDASVRRFVHMSALGARPDARSRYHRSKWEAEGWVRRSSLGWTIFRPSIIYGIGDGFVNLFAKLIRYSPVVPVMGTGLAKFQPVSVKSVAMAFVKALSDARTVGEAYDLCGPETLTLEEMIDEIMRVMKRTRLKANIPLGLAYCQAAFLEQICTRLFRKAPPLNRDQLTMLQEDNVGDGLPANLVFGLRHSPFREGIAGYLK